MPILNRVTKSALRKSKIVSDDKAIRSLPFLFQPTQNPSKADAKFDSTKSKAHVDVTSEKLCDDILNYLAPTLEQYKGCTLIDVHPGACVWSSKLHEFLRPKRHILFEPDRRYFEPFIKPLLEASGSTYRHVDLAGHHPWAFFRRWMFVEREHIPERVTQPSNDPNLRSFNSSILVTGNLARKWPTRMSTSFERETMTAYQLVRQANNALQEKSFHSKGLVRMLWWLPEELKGMVFPIGLGHKQASSMTIDFGTAATEIAGITAFPEYGLREHIASHRHDSFEHRICQRVAERMESNKLSAPTGRKLLVPKPSQAPEKYVYKSLFEPAIDEASTLLARVQQLDARVRKLLPIVNNPLPSQRTAKILAPYVESMQYPHVLATLPSLLGSRVGKLSHTRDALRLDLTLQSVNLEANFCRVQDIDPNNLQLEAMRRKILDISEMVRIDPYKITNKETRALADYVDYAIGMEASGAPILNRDARFCEPLAASVTEFYPNAELFLLDMVPRTRNLAVPDLADQGEAARFANSLMQLLYRANRSPLPDLLDHLAVNAGRDLIEMTPSLRDPRKGGRLNPMHMTPRMLTDETLADLVRAFFEWPFRPDPWELALDVTSREYGSAEEDALRAEEAQE